MDNYYYDITKKKVMLPSELAYYLVCARVNPALPPRARSVAAAKSKIWTSVALVVAAREATRAQLARVCADAGSAILPALEEVAPCAARIAVARTLGSWRKQARDCGGHGALFLGALRRALLGEHPGERVVRVAAAAYPLTLDAIHCASLAVHCAHGAVPPSLWQYDSMIERAIMEEWVIGDGADAETSADADRAEVGENAQKLRVFADEE